MAKVSSTVQTLALFDRWWSTRIYVLAGLAVLLDLADKSFRSPDDIAAEIGAPVLGTFQRWSWTDRQETKSTVDGSLCTIHHSRGSCTARPIEASAQVCSSAIARVI